MSNKNGAIVYNTENAVRFEAAKAFFEEIFNIQIPKDLLNKKSDIDYEEAFARIVEGLKD